MPLGAFAPLVTGLAELGAGRALGDAADAVLADVPLGSTLLIGVDDAHLLDPSSAALLHYLAVGREVGVVVTVRAGEVAPDAVSSLWRDYGLERLHLDPLSEADVAALLETVLGGSVEPRTLRMLWTLTLGNVLWLRNLVDGELRAHRLARLDGSWQLVGEPVLSADLAELVEASMGHLDHEVRDVLDLLSIGEPIGVETLTGLADGRAIEAAEQQGLVAVTGQAVLRVRLAHPMYGEVCRARMGVLRARRLSGRLATAFARSRLPDEASGVRRGVLMLDSDLPHDHELLGAAALSASRLVDLPLAERLARAALTAGGGYGPLLTLAMAESFTSRPFDADAHLRELYDLAATETERLQATVARAANLLWTGQRARG
jgi:hypothetical protein